MSAVDAIVSARQKTADCMVAGLQSRRGDSESDVRDAFLQHLSNEQSLFPEGWYDPPPGGSSVLFSQKPFSRLQYESLRTEMYWPDENFSFADETVGALYLSSVDRETRMIGDVALTVYNGKDRAVQNHIKHCHDVIYSIANFSAVGMKFSELHLFAKNLIEKEGLKIGWMANDRDLNFGHTVPGSYSSVEFGSTFEQIREAIRTQRTFIHASEEFSIPEAVAFTVEARLVDIDETLPNTLFHFIVIFREGEKHILSNFDKIFKHMSMDYMFSKKI